MLPGRNVVQECATIVLQVNQWSSSYVAPHIEIKEIVICTDQDFKAAFLVTQLIYTSF